MTNGDADPYVVGRIQEALVQESGAGEFGVQVAMRGEDVYLTGEVPTEERRDAITAIVRGVAPDRRIHNEISVFTVVEPRGSENLT